VEEMKERYLDIDWREGFSQCESTPGKLLGYSSREWE